MSSPAFCPVLWTLSKRSGSLFQAPLLAALTQDGTALAVAARTNPVAKTAEQTNQLLACPVTITDPREAFLFSLKFWQDRKRLTELLKSRGSLVHVTMGSPWDALYLPAARRAGLKTLVTVHDATRHPGEENHVLEALEHHTLSRADHIVTMSRHVFDEFRRTRNYQAPVHLIEGGLLTQSAPQVGARKLATDRPPRILFLGRIQPYKGLALLLEALCLLQEQGLNFELVIAGSGDLAPFQQGLSLIKKQTILNDWLSDDQVRTVLEDSDIMAITYVEASQSGIALDAQWAALPSVATPVGALPKQLTDGVDAIFAEEVSAKAVSSAFSKLMTDPHFYGKLSAGAHAAYQKVGLRPVAEKWRSLYSDILNGGN